MFVRNRNQLVSVGKPVSESVLNIPNKKFCSDFDFAKRTEVGVNVKMLVLSSCTVWIVEEQTPTRSSYTTENDPRVLLSFWKFSIATNRVSISISPRTLRIVTVYSFGTIFTENQARLAQCRFSEGGDDFGMTLGINKKD